MTSGTTPVRAMSPIDSTGRSRTLLQDIFSDRHAQLLNEITRQRGSNIAVFDCSSLSLTSSGLNALERVFNRSNNLVSIRLNSSEPHERERLKSAIKFARRFQDQLTSLRLSGKFERMWLPQLVSKFPLRSHFTVLEEFYIGRQESLGEIGLHDNVQKQFSSLVLRWVASMVSVPSRRQTRLKSFGLSRIPLQQQDMSTLIKAIDLSTLVELRLMVAGTTQMQLERLADRIIDGSTPLKLLGLSYRADTCALREKLREKAQVNIEHS